MTSLLDCVPAVNPAFSRPTANLAGVDLFHAPNGVTVLTLATGKGRSLRKKVYHVEEIPTALGGRAFRLTPGVSDTLAGGETEYVVLVNAHDSSCTCAGHQDACFARRASHSVPDLYRAAALLTGGDQVPSIYLRRVKQALTLALMRQPPAAAR
jgi:hypothetical protein